MRTSTTTSQASASEGAPHPSPRVEAKISPPRKCWTGATKVSYSDDVLGSRWQAALGLPGFVPVWLFMTTTTRPQPEAHNIVVTSFQCPHKDPVLDLGLVPRLGCNGIGTPTVAIALMCHAICRHLRFLLSCILPYVYVAPVVLCFAMLQ